MAGNEFGHEVVDFGMALDWDGEIEKENEFILLPSGEYDFTVVDFARQRFEGSEKMSACPVAKLTLEIASDKGTVTVFDRLMLNSKMEWKLSSFFGAIGQKRHGEKLKMNWNDVIGSTGRAKIKTREYNGRKYNEVQSYIYKEDVIPSRGTGSSYQAGSF